MTFIPKRPSSQPSNRPAGTGVGVGSQRPGPASLKDALNEARAISGGGSTRPSAVPGSGAGRAKKVIFLIDDEPLMRAKLRVALEPYYDIVEAKDGLEAAELVASMQPPAMFVCDVLMPRMDGFTFAKIMRSHPIMKRVPIMFVSSRDGTQEVTQALVLGACQYVPKTTPVDAIVAKIRKIVP